MRICDIHVTELMDVLVRLYFEAGYSYKRILRFLASLHDVSISMRTLKRLLHRMGLKRRPGSDLRHVVGAVQVFMLLGPATHTIPSCHIYKHSMYMEPLNKRRFGVSYLSAFVYMTEIQRGFSFPGESLIRGSKRITHEEEQEAFNLIIIFPV